MTSEPNIKKSAFKVIFFSDFEEVIESQFNSFVLDINLNKEDRRDLLTATMELALNAEEHSQSPDGCATITFMYMDNRFMIRVEDKGTGLEQNSKTGSPFRGNGLKLTRALVDSLIVSDYEKGLVVTTIKEIKRGV